MREVTDLVEEERPALGHLDLAGDAAIGARERAALVAEQLALDELRGQRRAVDGHEGPAWRSELTWIALENSPFPVPVSPRRSTVASVCAASVTRS